MTTAQSLHAALVGACNDNTSVEAYGQGHLVRLPLTYSDGDSIVLYVEDYEAGSTLSDRGEVSMRLDIAGVSFESPTAVDAWRRALGDTFTVDPEVGVVQAWVPRTEVGAAMWTVTQSVLRAEQMHLLAPAPRRERFDTQVVRRLRTFSSEREEVVEKFRLRLMSGRQRQVTAMIRVDGKERLVLQAMSGQNKQTRETAVEHAFFLFEQAAGLPREQRLAVAGGSPDAWEAPLLEDLRRAVDVEFFDDASFDGALSRRVQQLA